MNSERALAAFVAGLLGGMLLLGSCAEAQEPNLCEQQECPAYDIPALRKVTEEKPRPKVLLPHPVEAMGFATWVNKAIKDIE